MSEHSPVYSPPPALPPPSPPLLHIMPLLLYFKKTLFPLSLSHLFPPRVAEESDYSRAWLQSSSTGLNSFLIDWLAARSSRAPCGPPLAYLYMLHTQHGSNRRETNTNEWESTKAGRRTVEYSITFKSKERLSPPHRYIFFLFLPEPDESLRSINPQNYQAPSFSWEREKISIIKSTR